MKVLIKEITNVNTDGVSFKLTDKAGMNSETFKSKTWFVSWDKIGRSLFGDQYSDAYTVADLRLARGEESPPTA